MAKKYTIIWDEKEKKPKIDKHDGDVKTKIESKDNDDKVKIDASGNVTIKGDNSEVVIPCDIWNHGSGPFIMTVEY